MYQGGPRVAVENEPPSWAWLEARKTCKQKRTCAINEPCKEDSSTRRRRRRLQSVDTAAIEGGHTPTEPPEILEHLRHHRPRRRLQSSSSGIAFPTPKRRYSRDDEHCWPKKSKREVLKVFFVDQLTDNNREGGGVFSAASLRTMCRFEMRVVKDPGYQKWCERLPSTTYRPSLDGVSSPEDLPCVCRRPTSVLSLIDGFQNRTSLPDYDCGSIDDAVAAAVRTDLYRCCAMAAAAWREQLGEDGPPFPHACEAPVNGTFTPPSLEKANVCTYLFDVATITETSPIMSWHYPLVTGTIWSHDYAGDGTIATRWEIKLRHVEKEGTPAYKWLDSLAASQVLPTATTGGRLVQTFIAKPLGLDKPGGLLPPEYRLGRDDPASSNAALDVSWNTLSRKYESEWLLRSLSDDLVLAVGSCALIFAAVFIQTGSLFLTVVGITHVTLTAPGAYTIYTAFVSEGGEYFFPILCFLGTFVILGIGADDLFVYTDAWKQSFEMLPDDTPLKTRVAWTHRRAATAMLITSITTAGAFLSNVFAPVASVRLFALYMGILVLLDFVLVITIYPAAIVVRHRCCIEKGCCYGKLKKSQCRTLRGTRNREDNPPGGLELASIESDGAAAAGEDEDDGERKEKNTCEEEEEEEEVEEAEVATTKQSSNGWCFRFITNQFFGRCCGGAAVLLRFVSPPLLLVFGIICMWQASTIPPPSEAFSFWPSHHPIYRSQAAETLYFPQSDRWPVQAYVRVALLCCVAVFSVFLILLAYTHLPTFLSFFSLAPHTDPCTHTQHTHQRVLALSLRQVVFGIDAIDGGGNRNRMDDPGALMMNHKYDLSNPRSQKYVLDFIDALTSRKDLCQSTLAPSQNQFKASLLDFEAYLKAGFALGRSIPRLVSDNVGTAFATTTSSSQPRTRSRGRNATVGYRTSSSDPPFTMTHSAYQTPCTTNGKRLRIGHRPVHHRWNGPHGMCSWGQHQTVGYQNDRIEVFIDAEMPFDYVFSHSRDADGNIDSDSDGGPPVRHTALGWTRVLWCDGPASRFSEWDFPPLDVRALAQNASRIRICLAAKQRSDDEGFIGVHASNAVATNFRRGCVESTTDSFPIDSLRKGLPFSHNFSDDSTTGATINSALTLARVYSGADGQRAYAGTGCSESLSAWSHVDNVTDCLARCVASKCTQVTWSPERCVTCNGLELPLREIVSQYPGSTTWINPAGGGGGGGGGGAQQQMWRAGAICDIECVRAIWGFVIDGTAQSLRNISWTDAALPCSASSSSSTASTLERNCDSGNDAKTMIDALANEACDDLLSKLRLDPSGAHKYDDTSTTLHSSVLGRSTTMLTGPDAWGRPPDRSAVTLERNGKPWNRTFICSDGRGLRERSLSGADFYACVDEWLNDGGGSFTFDAAGWSTRPRRGRRGGVGSSGWYFTGGPSRARLIADVMAFSTPIKRIDGMITVETKKYWRALEHFMSEFARKNADAPASVRSAWQSEKFYWGFFDLADAMLVNAAVSATVALVLSGVILLVATGNVRIAVMGAAAIASTIAFVMALLVWNGWELNIMESMCMSILAGIFIYVYCMTEYSSNLMIL